MHFSGGRNNDQEEIEIESRVFHQIEFFSDFSEDQKFLKHYLDFRSPENIVRHKFDQEIKSI